MLNVQNVGFSIEGTQLLHAANVQFKAGSVTGLIGPNGAGKSTLLRIMAGLLPATQGQVVCDGILLPQLALAQRARRMAYMPQDVPPFPPMLVQEVASLGRLPYGESPAQALHHPAVAQALAEVGLQDLADRPASHLSGGERARLMLARALAVQAPILLADEPVAALDPAHALAVMQVFCKLAAQGTCVVVVLHDLLLATRFCKTLVLMQQGRIRHIIPPTSLTDEMVRQTYGVTTRRVENAVVPWDLCTAQQPE